MQTQNQTKYGQNIKKETGKPARSDWTVKHEAGVAVAVAVLLTYNDAFVTIVAATHLSSLVPRL